MTTQTKNDLSPPSKPPRIALGYESDEIEAIGDLIAKLSPAEALDLLRYLAQTGKE